MIDKLLSKLSSERWAPDNYKIYKPSTTYHNGIRYCQDIIIYLNNDKTHGSFSTTANWCEIRTPDINIIIPLKKVKFYKGKQKIKCGNTGEVIGDTNELNYTIMVMAEYTGEDIKRWTKWKHK